MFIEAIKFSKNADIDKYGYSGFEIGFDRKFTGYWIRQKCNDFWSRCEFIKKDIKMFGFVKKAVFTGLTISSSVKPLNAALLKFVSMTYWE